MMWGVNLIKNEERLFSLISLRKEIQTIITTTDESLGAYGKEIKIGI